MGVVINFDPNAWRAAYPEFVNVSDPMATQYFGIATLYHANDGSGPVNNSVTQTALLFLLTSHIAWLMSARDQFGNPSSSGTVPAPNILGRISSASEGSVSVSMENQQAAGTPQWYQTTKYGQQYWAATAAFRTIRYRPGPRRRINPPPFSRGGF